MPTNFSTSLDNSDIPKKIRDKILLRGYRGIFSLYGYAKNNILSFQEILQMNNGLRLGLNNYDIQRLFDGYDQINFDELIKKIRGINLNEYRLKAITNAFNTVKNSNNIQGHQDEISYNDIKESFSSKGNPEVIQGNKTEDDVYIEFNETFSLFHKYYVKAHNCNGQMVSLQEFIEYYENISIYYNNDEEFENLLENSFVTPSINSNSHSRGRQYVKVPTQKLKTKNRSISQPRYSNKFEDKFNKTRYIELTSDKFKNLIKQSGIKPITFFICKLKLLSLNPYGNVIDFDLFNKIISESRVTSLTKSDIKNIFNYYDTDKEGYANVNDIINDLIKPMNSKRQNVVIEAFDYLDVNNKGSIEINQLKNAYNASLHPKVIKRQSTLEDEYTNFIDCFETFHEYNNKLNNNSIYDNFKISKGEFIDYYTYESFIYDNDEDFIQMVKGVWDLPDMMYTNNSSNKTNNVYNNYIISKAGKNELRTGRNNLNGTNKSMFNQAAYPNTFDNETYNKGNKQNSIIDPIQKLKKILIERGVRGLMSLRRSLMINDVDNSRNISMEDLSSIFDEYRMNITENELECIFDKFKAKKNGVINYDLLIDEVMESMNKRRENILEKVYDKLSQKNNFDFIEMDDIRKTFNPKGHIDVVQNKRKEGEVLSEFLDIYEYHFYLLQYNNHLYDKKRKIFFGDLIKFYNIFSMYIDSDDDFEDIINGTWEI